MTGYELELPEPQTFPLVNEKKKVYLFVEYTIFISVFISIFISIFLYLYLFLYLPLSVDNIPLSIKYTFINNIYINVKCLFIYKKPNW